MGTDSQQKSELDGWNVLNILDYPINDIGSAKMFSDVFSRKLKFVRGLGMYFYFDGRV